jgi:hypothetical protein
MEGEAKCRGGKACEGEGREGGREAQMNRWVFISWNAWQLHAVWTLNEPYFGRWRRCLDCPNSVS